MNVPDNIPGKYKKFRQAICNVNDIETNELTYADMMGKQWLRNAARRVNVKYPYSNTVAGTLNFGPVKDNKLRYAGQAYGMQSIIFSDEFTKVVKKWDLSGGRRVENNIDGFVLSFVHELIHVMLDRNFYEQWTIDENNLIDEYEPNGKSRENDDEYHLWTAMPTGEVVSQKEEAYRRSAHGNVFRNLQRNLFGPIAHDWPCHHNNYGADKAINIPVMVMPAVADTHNNNPPAIQIQGIKQELQPAYTTADVVVDGDFVH